MVNPRMEGAPIPGTPAPTSTGYLAGVSATMQAARAAIQPNIPMIWLGDHKEIATNPATGAPRPYAEPFVVDRTVSITDLMMKFEGWSDKRKREMAKRLAQAGMFSTSPYKDESLEEFVSRQTLGDVQAAYANLLESASARWQQAGQKITPDQLLDMHIQYNKMAAGNTGIFGDGDGPGGAEDNFTGTKTQVNRSVDIFDADSAKGLARATLRRELDRDPTEEEFEDFVAALQTYSRQHPTINRVTQTYEDGELTGTNSVTRGGYTQAGVDELLTRQAQSTPGWAEWQAAGQFLPAALGMLGAGVTGV